MTSLERAQNDPEFEFSCLDGERTAYVNRKTGCTIFTRPFDGLSPNNLRLILLNMTPESRRAICGTCDEWMEHLRK